MEKLKKMSRIINVILTVLLVGVILAALYTVYFSGIAAFMDFDPGSYGLSGLNVGYLQIRLNEYVYPDGYKTVFQISLAATILSAAFAIYTILELKGIFRPMVKGLPFETSISRTLTRLAWAVLIFGIVSTLLEFGLYTTMYNVFDLGHLLLNDIVESVRLDVVADGDFVVWFVILLLLSYVFRYGQQLQQLSDETL